MFDIGFWELTVIGVIALLVVGPERLPGLARQVGLWVGRIRRYVAHVKADVERELHAEEMRQLLQKPEGLDDLAQVARDTESALSEAEQELSAAARDDARGDERAGSDVADVAPDDDPFATSSLDAVTPAAGAGADLETAADADVSDDEQQPEPQGRT